MKHLKYFENGVWLPSEEGDDNSTFGYTLRKDDRAMEYFNDKGESITSIENLQKFLRKYCGFLSSETFDPFYDPGKSRLKQLENLGIFSTEWVDYDYYQHLNFWDENDKLVGYVEIKGTPPNKYCTFHLKKLPNKN